MKDYHSSRLNVVGVTIAMLYLYCHRLNVGLPGLTSEAFIVNSNNALHGKQNPTLSNSKCTYTSKKALSSSSPFSSSEDDCGCNTIFTGKPSDVARNEINHRSAIATIPIYKIDGSLTTIDAILGDAKDINNQKKTSLVVFLRSLG